MTWSWKRCKSDGGCREGNRFLPVALSSLILCVLPLQAGHLAAAEEPLQGSQPENQKQLSPTVQKIANAIDTFFVSDRQLSWKETETAVTLRLDTDFIEYHGVEFNPKLRFRLRFPGLKRLSLVGNEQDAGPSDYTGPGADDESSFALRWTGRSTDTRRLSLDAGARIKDSNLEGFGRLNAAVEYPLGSTWLGRTTNRLYWYTEAGWRNDLRQYFERRLGENLFFRSRTRLQDFEEYNDRLYPEQKFTIYQRRRNGRSVLAYEVVAWVIPGEETVLSADEIRRPDDDYTRYLALLRYRTRVKWPWLFIEVWPGIGVAEEVDYRSFLYAKLRVDITFGHIFEKETVIGE